MQFGIRAKFDQNEELATFLKGAGDTTLVEASPYDKYWGVACSLNDPDVWEPTKWKGTNTLGKMLSELRNNLK